MISMSKVQDIRDLRKLGENVSDISKKTGVSRPTVYKYLAQDDFSPSFPAKRRSRSGLDGYRPFIEGYLDEDARAWHKQRHTAKRIFERLRDEHGCPYSESTVRHYVAAMRAERAGLAAQFLSLEWAPGEAQVDFGEADFYVCGVRTRLDVLVLSFPYSNIGIAQVFRGENAECVCQGLKDIFGYLGGVPRRLVFDNAVGVGRKVSDGVRTAELFGRFAAHYGFSFSFCNPDAGHEKGNVENKVGFIRRNLLVPVPQITDIASYNSRLAPRCFELSKDAPHWRRGEPQGQLFVEDRVALLGLPAKEFEVVRYERRKASKQGRIRLEGVHTYSSAPEYADRDIIVGIGADTVRLFATDGTPIVAHRRAYGSAPTDSEEPASQLALLCTRPNAWQNSQVRADIEGSLREHLDGLDGAGLKAALRCLRNQSAQSGYASALEAMHEAYMGTGRIDEASMAVAAARIASGSVLYDEPVDLGAYDRALAHADAR